jgi:hypothetical protein
MRLNGTCTDLVSFIFNIHFWARYAANDEKMAQWLDEAERQRNLKR